MEAAVTKWCVYLCVYVFVCAREREREREKKKKEVWSAHGTPNPGP